jgi:hypothetical protein
MAAVPFGCSADVVVRVMDYSAHAVTADSKVSFRCGL